MASAFGHIVSAIGIGSVFSSKEITPKILLIGAVSAAMPDIDVLSSAFGIGGLDLLGHRGITHSFAFAMIWALVLIFVFHKEQKSRTTLFFYYAICTMSHGIIDGLTNGGDGIAYFAPFSDFRTHLPFELIQVSPLGIKNFFSEWGISVLISEFFWIGIPTIILIVVNKILKR